MLSRLLAVGREQIHAALFGATLFSDAYRVAFRIPNLLRDLFAEGALSAAFIPEFAARWRHGGRQFAYRLANVVIGGVLLVVGGIAAIGIAASPQVVALLAPDFARVGGKAELTVELTRVMFPFLPLVSLAAVAMGQLNAQERYGAPALASAAFNVVAVAAGAALLAAGLDARTAVLLWAVATVAGGATQIAIQVPALYRTGFRFRPRLDLRDPALLRIARLMAPATLGLAATQINIVVNTSFASGQPGAVSWLDYAFRLMQLPIGVFGVAIATIATTRLAHQAAAGRLDAMADTLNRGLRLVAFLTIPCAAGLIAVAEPVVRLLYEHGAFGAADTQGTAAALIVYVTGLYAYSGVKVLAPAFYALDRPRIAVIASFAAVAANLAVSFALFPRIGHPALALGTAAAAVVNFSVLATAFHRFASRLDAHALARQAASVLAAAAACGAAAWAVQEVFAAAAGTGTLALQLAQVGASVGTGVLVYLACCRTLRVGELDDALAFVRRR